MPRLFRSPDRAPLALDGPSVFLAGSIEMGKAALWQPRVAAYFLDAGVHVFDPRRTDWDASWAHDPTPGTPFHTQVSWELDHIAAADLVYFRLGAEGPAVISMLELGLVLGQGKPVVIHAEEGYMRRGNIAITARRHNAPVFAREDNALAWADAHLLGLKRARAGTLVR